HRQVHPRHQHHGLDPGQGVPGRVGVDGGDRSVVAGVHGLEHVESLAAPALPHHDPVGPHPQRVADQVADADLALALDVRGTGLPMASGAITAFAREPSGRRASTIGFDSSTRRPTWATIFSMIRLRWFSSMNDVAALTILPLRST